MIRTIAGVDVTGGVKVYESIAPTDVPAPYVVVNMVPTVADTGAYGDDYVIQVTEFQVTAWGRNDQEAWLLADACDDALRDGFWITDPWQLMKVRRDGVPAMFPDRDTNLRQVQVRYRAMFGR